MANQVKRIPPSLVKTLVSDPNSETAVIPVEIVGGSNGPLTLKQKIKAAYKTLVAFVGSLTASLIAILGVPGVPENVKGYIATAVLACTVLGVFLVKNQEFIEKL